MLSLIGLITRAPSDTRREVDDLGREYIDVDQRIVKRNSTLKRDVLNHHHFLEYKIQARKNQDLPQSKSAISG